MIIKITVETETGEHRAKVFDSFGLLTKLIERSDLTDTSICLRFIDPYGDTVFNKLQMKPLLREIKALASTAESQQEKDLLLEIEKLAMDVEQNMHTYLKFYGD